jgi:hypothetical protein
VVRDLPAEKQRLDEDARRTKNWKRWGPYLSERQWGTVREDYSADGSSWEYFSHDHARSRAYRWGEDGLLGITDRQGRLCFALALWNGKDPILKERLFGLTGNEGNHGEDIKEYHFYLDSTPTHSYMKALYKYPQDEFPYSMLIDENRKKGKNEPEFELNDTGVFGENRYFDITAEYAKNTPNDILIRITLINRGSEKAPLWILPTFWFRNTWSWGRGGEGHWSKPTLKLLKGQKILADHESLGRFYLAAHPGSEGNSPSFLFTENETNYSRIFEVPPSNTFFKDAFHEYVVGGKEEAVNPENSGTKAAALYQLQIPPSTSYSISLRLYSENEAPRDPFDGDFNRIFGLRLAEADQYSDYLMPTEVTAPEARILRQGYAGLLWTKQFYHYSIQEWLEGDPTGPKPPSSRLRGRNHDWTHLYNRDVISMPDKWEYPWYAAWDLAFHMIPFAKVDPFFAKEQLVLLLREWYMHPSGQIPAYEWSFSDVNPPVHAWAVWRVYKISASRGQRDRVFLARAFQKLLFNFTWWVNRKDHHGKHVFSGGFLGLDNIGVFDRSQALPTGGHLEQADGTAWMAFYCSTMLSMALELAREDQAYEDVASKFFEHFIAIADAINSLDGTGLWDEEDGFYYDHLHLEDRFIQLKLRSLVGLLPMIAVEILEDTLIDQLPGFKKRMNWFLENREDLNQSISCMETGKKGTTGNRRILAIPSRKRLQRMLRYLLDEEEFLSPHGIRSLSRVHKDRPYVFRADGREYSVAYMPGESNSGLFGGNSNWRGPIWFPINFLIIEALERYHYFYGDALKTECPAGSALSVNLGKVADELARRLISIFLPDPSNHRPCFGQHSPFSQDPHWRDYLLFFEYFHGDNGKGLGANHQTGWTALVVKLIEDLAKNR